MQIDQNSQIILQERILQEGETSEDMARRVAKTVANGEPELEESFLSSLTVCIFYRTVLV